MASTIDIFNSAKLDVTKLTGSNNFYNSIAEITESAKLQNKFISNIDYSDPANFCKFGSAEEYYKNAINYISTEYPYDACLADKSKWINSLNDLEYYIFKEEYPTAKGYVELSGSQFIKGFSPSRDISNADIKNVYVNGNKYFVNETLNFTDGFTFESWMKFNDVTNTPNILTINTVLSQSGGLTDVSLLKVFASASNIYLSGALSQSNFSYTLNNNTWHHYALSINANTASLYVDGTLIDKQSSSTILDTTSSYVFYKIGLVPTNQTGSYSTTGSYTTASVFNVGGNSLLSIDETRFWNKERQLENIGRYWFTNVNGNDFNDVDNNNLILYYKFNEGWNNESGDICLDYSGFKNDGIIINYNTYACRNTGSAIDLSNLTEDVEPESIVYAPSLSYSTGTLQVYYDEKVLLGSDYDELNIHSLYKKFPSWILEDEELNQTKHLKQIVQIISSYFDDLYNKIGEISKYKHQQITTDKNKLYPFYDKILTSTGFDVTELFNNLNIIEKISSRTEGNIFDEDIEKIKNAIFQNIYNNLPYILKSKGTEKSIRSFLRSYGISEELVRVNLYADKSNYVIGDKYIQTTAKKKTLTLVGDQNIYLSGAAIPTTTASYYSTLETSVIFPRKLAASTYETASVIGLFVPETSLSNNTSSVRLRANVMVETDEYGSQFCFYTGTYGSDTLTLVATSSKISNLYDDTVWNIAIGIKPNIDTTVGATAYDYVVDFRALNTYKENTPFITASTIATNTSMLVPYNRYFIGAYNTDLTGSLIYNSCGKYLYCNYWSTYLSDNELMAHNKDILSYGVE